MNSKLTIILIILIYSSAFGKQPNWVTKRPVNNAYYIGIDVVKKSNDRKYIQSAKNGALNDLSSEISVNISSELVDIAIEKSGLSEEEIRTEIHSSTKADLEGYELVDTWESDYEYWVYYRLSKSLFQSQVELKRENAIDLSLDLFKKAKEKEQNWATKGSTINSAIKYYVQALKPIESYYGDPLETVYNGNKIFLQNEICSSLQWILSNIKLKAINPKLNLKVGSALKNELKVSISLTEDEKSVIVTDLPVRFSFIKGRGELVETIRTDSKGIAKCQIISISPLEKLQMIKCSLDLSNYFTEDSTSNYLINILANINTPSSKFIINVIGPTVYLESVEYNLGNVLPMKIIEPKIKKYLSDKGYSFTDDITNADAKITIHAESRQGSEMYGQYIAFVDATISVTDMNSGEEIYKNSLQNKKGLQLSFEKAGLKAYQDLSKEISNNIVPEIMEVMK
jgi:hypothetical protein